MKDYLKVLGWLFFSLLFPSLFLVLVLQLSSAERESFVNSGLVRAAADSRTDLPPRRQSFSRPAALRSVNVRFIFA